MAISVYTYLYNLYLDNYLVFLVCICIYIYIYIKIEYLQFVEAEL